MKTQPKNGLETEIAEKLQRTGLQVRLHALDAVFGNRVDVLAQDQQGGLVAIEVKSRPLTLTDVAAFRKLRAQRVIVIVPPEAKSRTAASVQDYAKGQNIELYDSVEFDRVLPSMKAAS